MATVHVTLSRLSQNSPRGGILPVPDSVPAGEETIASSGAWQTIAGLAGEDALFWTVQAIGGNVLVRMGLDPDSGEASANLVQAGHIRDFAVTNVGELIAVKDF